MKTHQQYWDNLVDRIYVGKERLTGDDRNHYLINWFCGKVFRSGIIDFLESSWADLDETTALMRKYGFSQLADAVEACAGILFGGRCPTPELISELSDRLYPDTDDENYDELDEAAALLDEKLSNIILPLYDDIERLQIENFKIGIRVGLYSSFE